jgi:hypothetical protein
VCGGRIASGEILLNSKFYRAMETQNARITLMCLHRQ